MVKSEPEDNNDMFDPDYEMDSSINENSGGKKKRLLSRSDDKIEDLELDETSHSQSRGKIALIQLGNIDYKPAYNSHNCYI